MADSIFLTGATGGLGREILKGLLHSTDQRIYLLIRRKNRNSHWDRVRKILSACGLETFLGTRVQVLEGDVALPQLGLRPDEQNLLMREVSEIYHLAALTALNGSREECWRINVGGTLQVLELAKKVHEKGNLQRFFYFSTAFVSGSLQTYCAKEDELPERPAHANHYESSKCEAEKNVRRTMGEGLPVTIFRPSIVVGNSKTGEVSEFNVIYPFMRLFAHGILTILPTQPRNSFNIVPIDFVTQASLAIARQADSWGKTFHLVTQEPPSIEMLLELKENEYPHMGPIEIVSPESFQKEKLGELEQDVFEMLHPYLGYLNGNLTFDTANTERALVGTGISFPKTDYEFLKRLCQYAVDAGYLVLQ